MAWSEIGLKLGPTNCSMLWASKVSGNLSSATHRHQDDTEDAIPSQELNQQGQGGL